ELAGPAMTAQLAILHGLPLDAEAGYFHLVAAFVEARRQAMDAVVSAQHRLTVQPEDGGLDDVAALVVAFCPAVIASFRKDGRLSFGSERGCLDLLALAVGAFPQVQLALGIDLPFAGLLQLPPGVVLAALSGRAVGQVGQLAVDAK